MTKVFTLPVTVVHPGDVMLNHSLGHLVDVVTVSDTWVQYRDRAFYSAPLGHLPLEQFIANYQWVRNSPVLLACNTL
jgi:hypothetical protein